MLNKKRLVFAAILLIGMGYMISSCDDNQNDYIYLLYAHRLGTEEGIVKGDVIKAPNDSLAYLMAFEKFCNSVYGKLEDDLAIADEFILRDANDKEVKPVVDSVLSNIENRVIATLKPYLYNPSTYRRDKSGTYNSGSSDWKSNMETDEYKSSLAREVMLRQAGMKDAAKIERMQRNQYLRGGGYDSKDGGKQVHYNGSAQQQRDLDAIDKYMREHPDF